MLNSYYYSVYFRRKVFLISIILGVFLSSVSTLSSRKLKVDINQDCVLRDGRNCSLWTNKTLLHIRSDSSEDSIHFIWTFIGSPSLLLARTSLTTNLSVDWDRLFHENTTEKQNSIQFVGPKPIYTFAYSISEVLVFEDPKDVVDITKVNQSTVHSYNTRDFVWERNDKQSILNTSYIDVPFNAVQYKNHTLGPGGYFRYQVKTRDTDGYSDVLPFMLHNMNMTQTDISFSQVQMNYPDPNPEKIRIAFTLLLAQVLENSLQSSNESMRLEKIPTIDDEHTPGVFTTVNIRTPVLSSFDQSFLQWKPISYTGLVRDITDSIDVSSYEIEQQSMVLNLSIDTIDTSVLWAYYGQNISSILVYSTNVSFGTQKDGFYAKTPHISWTFMSGFGSPPEDYMSRMVIVVISVGLGIPGLIILGSVVYLMVKRTSRNQDDLLLGGQ